MPERIEISIIPQDLRHEETIVQIAEALDNLDFAVSHIFNSINERISENSKRLGDIRSRATKLQGRLDYLQTNLNLKAVKMYSAAKYPANHIYKEYKLTVQPKCRKETQDTAIYKSPVPISDKYDSPLTVNSKIENGQYVNSFNMQEKLQFYYVKSKPSAKTKTYEVENDRTRQNVSSIDSLLPFNTKDSRGGTNSQTGQNEDKAQIGDAPDSILQPWHSSEMESPSTYLYAPILGEVPQLNVPLTLPDLPGIVDDERFTLDLNFQSPIAPSSAVATPIIRKDPPSQSTAEQEPQNSQNPEKNVSKAETITSNIPVQSSAAPTPPAPQVKSEALTKDTSDAPPAPSQTAPPPPPPPPPPPLPASPPEEKQEVKQAAKQPTAKPASVPVDRSNLMAEIRDAGGIGRAKLRHYVPTDKTQDRWSSASVGGDLMADLHATLSLRRKCISGMANNAFARMSSMIPPPPKPNESSTSDRNSATSECESQDDDGWED